MKATSPIVTCASCLYGRLHRYGNNPILAACEQKPQQGNVRFPFAVEVASVLRRCSLHKLSPVQKTIEYRKVIA